MTASPKKRRSKDTPEKQLERFAKTAKEIGADENSDALAGIMRKVSQLKRPPKKKLS